MIIRMICFIGLMLISLCAMANDTKRQVPTTHHDAILSFAPILKHATKAVVNIYATQNINSKTPFSGLFNDPFFKQFFGDKGFSPRARKRNSLGSGVILHEDGLVVTNHHVIKNADNIFVILYDEQQVSAKVILQDEISDLAILKIEKLDKPLPSLPIGNSDTLEVGDIVLAIGNPFGVGQTVTSGIISALARTAQGISDHQSFIQTDAAINPGNSGGALIDNRGVLVGVNTAIFSRSGGSNGIGFAVPSIMVNRMLQAALAGKQVLQRPWIGFNAKNIDRETSQALGLHSTRGVLVEHVHKASPAKPAGLREGDIIIMLNNVSIDNVTSLRFRIDTLPISSTVNMTVMRHGKKRPISFTLIAPPEIPKRDDYEVTGRTVLDGSVLVNISPMILHQLQRDQPQSGVVIYALKAHAYATRVGFKVGDVIIRINDKKVSLVADIRQLIKQNMSITTLDILRDGKIVSLTAR